MRLIIFFLFCLFSFRALAQDLTGIWRGHFKSANINPIMDSLGIEDRYKFETQIQQTDKSFTGVTYSYKTTVFYGKASCFGAMNPKTKKVLLEETNLLEVKSQGGGACLMTCFLQYSKVGEEEFLEGSYTSMSIVDSTQCGGGTVFLRKVTNSDFYKEPFLAEKEKQQPAPPVVKTVPPTPKNVPPIKKTVPPARKDPPKTSVPLPKKQITASAKTNVPKPPAKKIIPLQDVPKKSESLKQLPADTVKKELHKPTAPTPVPRVLETRENELVKTIISPAKEIYIRIYDNGTVDNDTVSVYVDKKLVISKQRLTEKAITLKITLDEKTNFHELVMVAENLGEIPPNTSLMVVTAGDQQFEVRITSTEQKNAVVHFRKE